MFSHSFKQSTKQVLKSIQIAPSFHCEVGPLSVGCQLDCSCPGTGFVCKIRGNENPTGLENTSSYSWMCRYAMVYPIRSKWTDLVSTSTSVSSDEVYQLSPSLGAPAVVPGRNGFLEMQQFTVHISLPSFSLSKCHNSGCAALSQMDWSSTTGFWGSIFRETPNGPMDLF